MLPVLPEDWLLTSALPASHQQEGAWLTQDVQPCSVWPQQVIAMSWYLQYRHHRITLIRPEKPSSTNSSLTPKKTCQPPSMSVSKSWILRVWVEEGTHTQPRQSAVERSTSSSKLVYEPQPPWDTATNPHALCPLGTSNSISFGVSGIFHCPSAQVQALKLESA